MIDIPEQVILWDNADGTRQSEHRSIGDCPYFFDAGPRLHVLVRAPRDNDPVYAVLCTAWSCVPSRTCPPALGGGSGAGHRTRPAVLAVFEDQEDADEWAMSHADTHSLAREPFRTRRGVLYRRQARLERALA